MQALHNITSDDIEEIQVSLALTMHENKMAYVCLLLLATLSVTLLLTFHADCMIFALSFWVIYLLFTTCSE